MKCFSIQKLRTRCNSADRPGSLERNAGADSDEDLNPPMASTSSSARTLFRSRVRAIQNAQRFINGNPKLRSSHPSYGSREPQKAEVPEASSPPLPLGGRARSATELGSALFDVATTHRHLSKHLDSTGKNLLPVTAATPLVDDASATNTPCLQPLPSPPQVSPSLHKVAHPSSGVYRLPLPSDPTACPALPPLGSTRSSLTIIDTSSTHTSVPLPLGSKLGKLPCRPASSSSAATCERMQVGSNSILLTQTHQSQNVSDVISSSIPSHQDVIMHVTFETSELQPLPPPCRDTLTAWPLRCFKYEELSSACQNFGLDCRIADTDWCFNGTIKLKENRKAGKHQDVVVAVLKEPHQQGFQEWMSKLSMVAHKLHQPLHVCQLIGFYGEDGCGERMLVYERLKKGTLFSLLFEASDVPPLEWSMRMKIAYGAAQGLARLHEAFPDTVLYRDFRASSIQVDHDYRSKVSVYRFSETLNSVGGLSNPRVNAYRAPERVRGGELTLKSNVWSFGVILLELLSGKQHLDEETTKTERHNLVKWAKPFLVDEGKLFLLMDPKLQGKFPSKEVKMVAYLARVCLRKDPTKRPSMREALDIVSDVHQSKLTPWCSARGATIIRKATSSSSAPLQIANSSGANPSLTNHQRPTLCPKSPSKLDIIENPSLRPVIIPPRCGGEGIIGHQYDYSPAPFAHVKF